MRPTSNNHLHSLHLATSHRATDPRIVYKEARTLARDGRQVTVVLPHPESFEIDGVRVIGVRLPTSGKDRLLSTTREVTKRALEVAVGSEDVVFHIHEAELLPHGLALARRGKRVVYDAHEDTPRQTLHQAWIPHVARHPAAWGFGTLEWLAGKWFDGIIAAVPYIADRYPAKRTTVVRNYPFADEIQISSGTPYSERPAHMVYVGGLTEARGIREMMSAISRVADELEPHLHLVGPVHPASLSQSAMAFEGASRTTLHGYMGKEDVIQQFGHARGGLVLLHPTPQYLRAYPTKLFEYMGAGLPVIASDFPIIREFVEPNRCGLLVNPLDPQAISDAITWILMNPIEAEQMGRRGREAVIHQYNWHPEGERLLAFYRALDAGLDPGIPWS